MTAFSSGWSTDGGIQPLKRGLSPVRIQRDSLPSSTKDSLRERGGEGLPDLWASSGCFSRRAAKHGSRRGRCVSREHPCLLRLLSTAPLRQNSAAFHSDSMSFLSQVRLRVGCRVESPESWPVSTSPHPGFASCVTEGGLLLALHACGAAT